MNKTYSFLLSYIGFVIIISIIGLYWISFYKFGEGISKYMTVLGPTLSVCFVVKYGYSMFIGHFLAGLIINFFAPYYAFTKRSTMTKYLIIIGIIVWWLTGLVNFLVVRSN